LRAACLAGVILPARDAGSGGEIPTPYPENPGRLMLTSSKIDIDSLVSTELPPLPGSALRVAALAQDVNSSTRAIADAIGADPALATRVLRAANSPLYGMERRVTALTVAVGALGNQALHLLVIMSATSDHFDRMSRRSPAARALWEHSVAVSLAARELIQALGMRGGEEAFLCGLLHDIGKLLLLRYDQEQYEQLRECERESELLEREKEIYGYTHAQVGALVARRWGLPEEISYAIYNHHQPSEAGQFMFMARVIDAADGLANSAGLGLRKKHEGDLSTAETVIALRLSEPQLVEIWEKVQTLLGPTLQMLG
jgi:putative nucleotidyltransferase with HDIG domain